MGATSRSPAVVPTDPTESFLPGASSALEACSALTKVTGFTTRVKLQGDFATVSAARVSVRATHRRRRVNTPPVAASLADEQAYFTHARDVREAKRAARIAAPSAAGDNKAASRLKANAEADDPLGDPSDARSDG